MYSIYMLESNRGTYIGKTTKSLKVRWQCGRGYTNEEISEHWDEYDGFAIAQTDNEIVLNILEELGILW